MAEGLLKELLAANPELAEKYSVSSAGTTAYYGDPANPQSIRTLKENWGIDIGNHRSRLLQREDVESAYIVLTMTRGHKEEITSRFPQSKNKVYTLKEYVNESITDPTLKEYNFSLDIMDPFGLTYEVYKRCGEEIKEAVEKLAFKLKNEV
jgi:protein-tyrosine phosphatase